MKQLKKFDLESNLRALLYKTKGIAFGGWVCPVFAKIENDELYLYLGDAVKDFKNNNQINWITNAGCWQFPCDVSEQFPYDAKEEWNELINKENEIARRIDDLYNLSFKRDMEDIKNNIVRFCASEGYEFK
jgi:hypothetical protein